MSLGDAIAGIEKSLHEMNMLSYRVRDQIQATLVSDTTTDANYARYVRDYEFWWAKNKAHLCNDNPARTPIPPFPVTAGKVILFLDYELKRPKRKRGNNDESMEGTTVGSSVIRGAVSALERMRCRDAHLYPKDPEARIPLRSDDRIKRAEAAVKHHEPERVAKAQILKAVGSSADTYTVDELIDISKWCLTEPHTRNGLTTYLRDRSMHLMCTATAFRGDNARELGLSDLFLREVPNVHAGYDVKIMVVQFPIYFWSLRILCDNAKHNQSGKIEEQGMIRHRIPSLCAIGALGMHLFSLFHIAGQTMELEPDFFPAAQEAGFGEFGHRAWYDYKTYFAANISQPMSYTNHANRIKLMHEKNNVAISKVTHAGHIWSALIMYQYRTSVSSAKAIGQWSAAEAFANCYDQELPLEGLLGAAMFNAQKPEAPLPNIEAQIFPWVEEQMAALQARYAANPKAMDLSLQSFLLLLQMMRRILIQDLAVLYLDVPDCLIYSVSPFNTPEFQQYAEVAPGLISEAENTARSALKNLPEHMAQSLRGVVQNAVASQQAQASLHADQFKALEDALMRMEGYLGLLADAVPQKCQKIPISGPEVTGSLSDVAISGGLGDSETDQPEIITCTLDPEALDVSSELTTSKAIRPPLTTVSVTNSSLIPSLTSITPAPSCVNMLSLSSSTLKISGVEDQKALKHQWEWTGGNWVPYYEIQTVTTFRQLWDEYANGINGFLPVRVMHERWGKKPAWHCNVAAKKTDYGRCKKVAHLIENLSKRPHWDITKSLNFLEKTYSSKYTAGTFSQWLCEEKKNGKGANMRAIFDEAEKYKS
ncbi:hypothetical protein K439DRAFT_1617415 [Ramaria rubella]|nr:hypothetical protein K439DRAFT_1617415 [Ramaria rubella]